jgi:hypothetical protein
MWEAVQERVESSRARAYVQSHRNMEIFVAGSVNGARGKTAAKTSGAAVYHHHPAFV